MVANIFFDIVTIGSLYLFFEGAVALYNTNFGQGPGLVHIQIIACTGNESNITQCSYTTPATCNDRFASVRCTGKKDQMKISIVYVLHLPSYMYASEFCSSEGTVRLVGEQNVTEGTVQICMGGVWGTVCDNLWGTSDANVVCGQLGYSILGMKKELRVTGSR